MLLRLPSLTFWKDLANDFVDDDVIPLAAATAYYTTLCLSPLLLLSLAVIGALYPSAQERFLADVGALVGAQGQEVIRSIVENASERPDLRQFAGWIGVGVLLFGASAVFAQLQLALNRIWGMNSPVYHGAMGWIRRRLLSAGVLLAVLFLTLVSFVAQGVLNLVTIAPAFAAVAWIITFLLYAALFTTLYHWLPDGRVPWMTAFRGGVLTTALFMVGRMLIGLYLEKTDAAGAFGPAGALVVWLLWAFYSSLVFLFSAELLYAIARHRHWHWAESGDIGSNERGERPQPEKPVVI
ncbi:MAG TPA: YihY/virulence factor BrkB family protein [Verrucomicrobiae bacterium]|nr:YihY/virulence factor BrkB family protein [Verrucomicrobiae bacterium]